MRWGGHEYARAQTWVCPVWDLIADQFNGWVLWAKLAKNGNAVTHESILKFRQAKVNIKGSRLA